MLMCNEIMTLVHHIKGNDTDTYTCTGIPNCSWYAKTKAVYTDQGMKYARIVKARFQSLPAGAVMARGDFIVRGTVTSVTKPSDLEGTEYAKIVEIGDNRRGTNPHWTVTAE